MDTNIQNKALILVVDDDAAMRMLMVAALQQVGYEVVEAENGKLAIEKFESLRPDGVLLDVMMPEMDGFEACAAIRTLPGGEHVPVLMVTGLEDVRSIHQAFEAGATDFITKPITWPMLGYRVQYMLRASGAFHNLHKNQKQLAKAQNLAKLGHWELNLTTKRVEMSDECCRLLQLERSEVEKDFDAYFDAIHPEDKEDVRQTLNQAISDKAPYIINSRISLPDGEECIVAHQGEVVFDEASKANLVRGIIQDVTELKRAEEQVRHLAYYDALTGLANRSLFNDRLKKALARAKRNNRPMALMFLDLDRFKQINDSLGHDIGDMLLQSIADRITMSVRETDSIGRFEGSDVPDLVSRVGGDEFTVLLAEIARPEDAAIVAQRIIETIPQPLTLAGHEVYVTTSIGISVFPIDGDDPDTLMKKADTAMYYAKEKGRNNFQFYKEAINTDAAEKLKFEQDLRNALERNEFQLYYQPQLDSHSGEITGAEALIRWHHPERGAVSPVEFIPVAEESGLIAALTHWIMQTACVQNKAWQTAGLKPIRISVNLSSHQFKQQKIVEMAEKILSRCQLHPKYLGVEITEGAMMQNKEDAQSIFQQLKNLGLSIAVDDFGTGYSSLAYLKSFPIDTLKVDRSFVRDISSDPNDMVIVKAIVAMAQSMELDVIAEGVETEEQLNFLHSLGCSIVQGFLFSRPLPAADFAQLLQKGSIAPL